MRRVVVLLSLCASVACGRAERSTPVNSSLATNAANDAPPDPDSPIENPDPKNDKDPAKPVGEFDGSVSELRQMGSARSGLPVTLRGVVIVAISGNGEDMYVSDRDGGEWTGILVERCIKTDTECKAARPILNSTVDVKGKYFLNSGHPSIGQIEAVTVVDETPFGVPLTEVTTLDIEKGKTSGNESVQGGYVSVIDAEGADAVFVVEDVTPVDDTNANFPEALEGQCGPVNLAKPENSEVSCCPKGIGPKYFSFTIKEVATGRLVSVSTNNYRDVDISTWPCSARDLPLVIKVGDTFNRISGVFDVNFGKGSLAPTQASDYDVVRH